MEIKHVVCLLAFCLAGCASAPRAENFREEFFREVSVGFVELYENYQKSLGVELTQADLERNTEAAHSYFTSEMQRAASLRISNARDVERLLDRTKAAAAITAKSQQSSGSRKSFIHWVTAQVLEGEIKDSGQLKLAFALLSNETERLSRIH